LSISSKSNVEFPRSSGSLGLPIRPDRAGGMRSSSGSNSNVYSKARNRVGSVTGFEARLLFERRECGKYLKRIFASVVGVRYCNNPIVERMCNRQRQSSPAYASLVFLHQGVGKYYLFR